MLVIRRRAGETFLIGSDIQIELLEVGATQVKLGITAPRNIPILRKEVHVTRQQNEAASREMSTLELASLARRFQK
jgi:carbon storage regulator